MVKYKRLAYFLLFFGGILCLHLLYLGRNRHAFVWWCTGSVFCIGLFSDFWNLPSYVAQANLHDETGNRRERIQRVRTNDRPAFSVRRFLGQLLFSVFLALLLKYAFSDNFARHFPASLVRGIVVSMGIATAVHAVGNIGDEEVPFKPAIYGSFALLPLFPTSEGIIYKVVLSCYLSQKQRKVRRIQPQNPPGCMKIFLTTIKDVFIVLIVGVFVAGIWMSVLYNHILTQDGDTAKLLKHTKVFLRHQQKRLMMAVEATKSILFKLYMFLLKMVDDIFRVHTDNLEELLMLGLKIYQSVFPKVIRTLEGIQQFINASWKIFWTMLKNEVYPLVTETFHLVIEKFVNLWNSVYILANQTCHLMFEKLGDLGKRVEQFTKKMLGCLSTALNDNTSSRDCSTLCSDVEIFINSISDTLWYFLGGDSKRPLKFVPERDPYKVMGLDPSATESEIKRRYRKLAKEYHPDKHESRHNKKIAEKMFIQLHDAYETLAKISRSHKYNKRYPT